MLSTMFTAFTIAMTHTTVSTRSSAYTWKMPARMPTHPQGERRAALGRQAHPRPEAAHVVDQPDRAERHRAQQDHQELRRPAPAASAATSRRPPTTATPPRNGVGVPWKRSSRG